MAKTPMMQQYDDAKEACGDALLLFRMGDFYELFHDDAKTSAKILGLTLTSRDKGVNPIPMAGFPHHQLDGYLAKLIQAGYRVAVCEQVENPKTAVGLVKREVTRVVSPGTVTDDALLDPRESNFLVSIAPAVPPRGRKKQPALVGLSWADLSTGRFFAATYPEHQLLDQLARIAASECLVSEDAPPLPEYMRDKMMLTSRPAWAFGIDAANKTLERHFDVAGLTGFGFDANDTPAVQAAGALLDYLNETQKASLEHIDRLVPYRAGTALELDEATRRSLEVTRIIRDGRREGSLLSVLDRTVTSMGSRLLADWLSSPLTQRDQINSRLDAVQELLEQGQLCKDIREYLGGVYDIERLIAKVTTGRATPRDLSFIGRTLSKLPPIKEKLSGLQCQMMRELDTALDLCPELQSQLQNSLNDDCPLLARDGGFVKEGVDESLDQYRELAVGGKQWIASYQARIIEETGLSTLKVGFNKVFGYYLEVTHANRDRVPEDFIRKQTLKNAERFITPELKEYEEKVLTADDKAKDLEYQIFLQLREQVQQAGHRLQTTAKVLAHLDVLMSLAELASQRNYCRPEIVDEAELSIIDGRHPVLDIIEPDGTFVPNDSVVSPEDGMMMLITGPNMAGKSTYIRQVALLTMMAQMGSFLPASSAKIGIADRIFARVGASDELTRGQSTFMVEMTETARILNTATDRSLVILDEIGRGTSTYDGVSLAWAIVEYMHDQIGCRTFFATHYHELTDLEASLTGVRNYNVSVKEWEDNVVFLHKIVPGSADKSYGIHVARLAGVPKGVNERAKQVLAQLESEHLDESGRPKIANKIKSRPRGDIQMTLFGVADHPLLEQVRETDVNTLTPLEAMQLLQKWQSELADEESRKN